jgi:hypothetical protein
MEDSPRFVREFEIASGNVYARDYLMKIGVPDIAPATCPFDPGYDPLTFEGHLMQSSHLMETMKISMVSQRRDVARRPSVSPPPTTARATRIARRGAVEPPPVVSAGSVDVFGRTAPCAPCAPRTAPTHDSASHGRSRRPPQTLVARTASSRRPGISSTPSARA